MIILIPEAMRLDLTCSDLPPGTWSLWLHRDAATAGQNERRWLDTNKSCMCVPASGADGADLCGGRGSAGQARMICGGFARGRRILWHACCHKQ